MRLRLYPVIFLLCTCLLSSGQEDNLPDIIISIAEELASDETDPEAATIIIERLLELTENPVKINYADESELARIFFLTEFQVKVICDYIKTNGMITTIYEIAYLPGFDKSLAMMIKPFIVVDASEPLRSGPVKIKHTIMTNVSYRPESDSSSIDLSSLKLLTKYKLAAGRFTMGVTSEKDAGENSFFSTGQAPDFLSGYCMYQGTGLVSRLIAGDYSVRFGQGTNINSGIRSGVSLTTPDYMAGKNEIRQYSSTDENNFFRGAAASFNLKFIDVSMFYSQNKIDASLTFNEDSVPVYVKSIYKSGLHDIHSALLKKDVLTEISTGINISFNLNNLRAGLTWSENRFSLPVIADSTDLKDIYSFSGKTNDLLSGDYKWLYKNIILFGEYTINQNRGSGFLQGIRLKPDSRLAINLLFRHYSRGFRSIHGSAAGSGSQMNDETGILANFNYEAGRHFFINAGVDFQNYVWLKYRCDAPSWGKKYEFKAGYYPSDNLSVETYFNFRVIMINSDESLQINKPSLNGSRTLKMIIKYLPEANITLNTRIEYKILSPTLKTGVVLAQDCNFAFKCVPVRVWLRWCFF